MVRSILLKQNTASDSALIAIVAARSLFTRKHPNTALSDLVIYTTTQTHSLGAKAALVLGLSEYAIGVSPADDFALRGETLRKALERDSVAGRKPFVLSKFALNSII
jgi:aromatic-L-amino-acid/L-tryptophan decarboxylase